MTLPFTISQNWSGEIPSFSINDFLRSATYAVTTMHFILRTVRLPSKLKSRYRNHRETNALTFLPETVYM